MEPVSWLCAVYWVCISVVRDYCVGACDDLHYPRLERSVVRRPIRLGLSDRSFTQRSD